MKLFEIHVIIIIIINLKLQIGVYSVVAALRQDNTHTHITQNNTTEQKNKSAHKAIETVKAIL
jgi:hypothetical protein